MPQTPNPQLVADDEVIEVAWGNSVVNIIGNIASLALGSGVGSIANRLFDLAAVNATQQAQITTLQNKVSYKAHSGIASVTTNGSGAANVPVPAGMFPNGFDVIADHPDNGFGQPFYWLDVRAYGIGSTTAFQVQVAQRGQNTPFSNQAVQIRWIAVGPIF